MSEWTGFSDDDLKKLKKGPNQHVQELEVDSQLTPKKVQLGETKSKARRFIISPNRAKSPSNPNGNGHRLPKLSSLKAENVAPVEKPPLPPSSHAKSKCASSERRNSLTKMIPKLPSLPEKGEQSETEDEQQAGEGEAECDIEKDSAQAISEELSKVERFQQQQKMMEELNKQKRKILFQAISERQKQAAKETVKLKHIQQELSHLDNVLTADVSVMRDRIESVSIQFMEAQKKYSRIENEFIAVKLELYRTAELKEKLTEHLYMMIHKNEMRKAEKLSSLMEQLKLEDSMGSGLEMGVTDLPPLSAFSTYSVSTFPSPKGPGSPIQLVNVPCVTSHVENAPHADALCSEEVASHATENTHTVPEEVDGNSPDVTNELKTETSRPVSSEIDATSTDELSNSSAEHNPEQNIDVEQPAGDETSDSSIA